MTNLPLTEHTMDWSALLSTQRFKIDQGHVKPVLTHATIEGAPNLRSDFHIDHDRITFSKAFRCLGRKTQVHPLAQRDHTHNRLTHSVEVASVGRSLGNRVGAILAHQARLPDGLIPFDIGAVVQVACLAHDIGNPPFGHTGEEALREWFRRPSNQHWLAMLSDDEQRDISTYEGNAHSLRVLASLEMYLAQGGMRLTAATIGSLIKYPWTAPATPVAMGDKFSIYGTELPYFQSIADELGLLKRGDNIWCRHPLSYLVEAADDICYAILDLEDAVEMNILDAKTFEALFMPCVGDDYHRLQAIRNLHQKCAMLRSIVMGRCMTELADCFMLHHDKLLSGNLPAKDLISICDETVKATLVDAKALASEFIYYHTTKLPTEIAAFACLGSLLEVFIPVVHERIVHQKNTGLRQRLILDLLSEQVFIDETDSLYTGYMKVLDYLGAMSDQSAADLARTLSGLNIT